MSIPGGRFSRLPTGAGGRPEPDAEEPGAGAGPRLPKGKLAGLAGMDIGRRIAEKAPALEEGRRVPETPAGPPEIRPTIPLRPDLIARLPEIRPDIIRHLPFPIPRPVPPQPKTATELARSAIVVLSGATADVIREAMSTINAKNLAANTLLTYLERKVRVGEVLNELAREWSEATKGDFGEAFQMDRNKTGVMDAIVSIAVLNDPELDEEILVENTPDTTPEDLLENRVIVDQWPRGGTVMQPPYLILVAVEYRSVAQAEEVVRSIMGQLVEHQAMKLPRVAVEKIRG